MAIMRGLKPSQPLLWFILTDSGLNLCATDACAVKKFKLPPGIHAGQYQTISKSFYHALLLRKTLTINDMEQNANGSYSVQFIASGGSSSKKQLEELRNRPPVCYCVISGISAQADAGCEGGDED